jgi:hypothetical protein
VEAGSDRPNGGYESVAVAPRHIGLDLPTVDAAVKPADRLPFYATIRRRQKAALQRAESGFPYRSRGKKKARTVVAGAA